MRLDNLACYDQSQSRALLPTGLLRACANIRIEQARDVLDALLEKYVDTGIESVEDINVLKIQPLNQFGTPLEIVKTFGGKEQYEMAVRELEQELYRVA